MWFAIKLLWSLFVITFVVLLGAFWFGAGALWFVVPFLMFLGIAARKAVNSPEYKAHKAAGGRMFRKL